MAVSTVMVRIICGSIIIGQPWVDKHRTATATSNDRKNTQQAVDAVSTFEEMIRAVEVTEGTRDHH